MLTLDVQKTKRFCSIALLSSVVLFSCATAAEPDCYQRFPMEALVTNDNCDGLEIHPQTLITACKGEEIYGAHSSSTSASVSPVDQKHSVLAIRLEEDHRSQCTQGICPAPNYKNYLVKIGPIGSGEPIGWLRRPIFPARLGCNRF